MFPQDIVPGQLSGKAVKGQKRAYHSVSALGSSMGTLILSSMGAAIFGVWYVVVSVACRTNSCDGDLVVGGPFGAWRGSSTRT